jgi:type II secretory pathway component PulF
MPFFRYSATNGAGQILEGTIQANTPDEARLALARSGLNVRDIQSQGPVSPAPRPANQQIILSNPQPPAPQAPAPNPPTARPPTPRPPAPRPRVQPGPPQPLPTPAPSYGHQPQVNQVGTAAPKVVHTIPGTDKDRFFLFAQLAAAMRAGINPALAFDQISTRSKPYYTESLRALSAAATEGVDLAQVMERYPDLYPEHVVGMTRAGQIGGFLPDAFAQISDQAETAHKFKRWFFWIWFVFVNALLGIPGMIWATQAMVRSWELIDAKGGSGNFADALRDTGKAYLQLLMWPNGPAFLLVCAVVYALYRTLGSRIARRFRHRIGLKFPVYGPRARHENLSRFSWSLSRLAMAGFAPARAWDVAADTVPNLEMRDMLKEVAGRLSGAERLSDVLHGSRLFPDEYAPVIATAEYTGDLGGALDGLSRSSKAEFEAAQNWAKARSGCWGALGCFLTSAIMFGILLYVWYYQLPAKILSGFDTP